MDKWFRGQLQYDIFGFTTLAILTIGSINLVFFDNSKFGLIIVIALFSSLMVLGLLNFIVMIGYGIYKFIFYLRS